MLASKKSALIDLLANLKTLVKEKFYNNPSIVYIKSSEHAIKDLNSGIDFNVKIMESLNHKPEGQKDTFAGESQVKKNPFVPPFEEGQVVCDILDRHRLLFNKFSVCDEHVLLVTQEFESQLNPLNKSDWMSALVTCRSLDAMLYFNCGFLSGASIPHKHMQLIPYSSLYNSLLPVEEAALAIEEREKMF